MSQAQKGLGDAEPVLIGGVPVAEYVTTKWSHLERGDALAPPPDRPADPLDEVVAGVVASLMMSTRMYPETYAWIIADAIRTQQVEPTTPERTPHG
ncbi:hypothetical protein [Pseudoclavibacter terrae]|uniref:hypothetical protein n=1 Tax=Pseudoclavibacter terrae TaxID=1530195 RepID=UPI00232E1A2F|nr:hypothetical protein [Pseudoclavibacter terrae]